MINQSEAEINCRTWFGIALPTSHDNLKSCFRTAAKSLHPDVAGPGGHEKFIKRQAFYKQLVEANSSWAFSDVVKEAHLTDGTPLSELGLGLGSTKNGRDCDACQHKGYKEEHPEGIQSCSNCDYSSGWTYNQPCNRCKGTGNFMKGDKVVGPCYGCRGSGIWHSHTLSRCTVCKGVGYKYVPSGTVEYHMCYDCKGTGEIEIYNPVIRKGILAR